jgi:signal transduction histidine kinase
VLLVVGVSAVASRLYCDHVARSAADRRANEAALAEANQCLEAEAGRHERLINELEARNAELERFAYTVSHDLKSPLVTIRGYLDYLEASVRKGEMERFRGDLARIVGASDRMRRLLDDLLELSRIGRIVNPPEEVSLRDLAQEAVALVQGRLAARGAQVVIAEDLPVVRGDRQRLLEVLQNLLDNAAKSVDGAAPPRIEVGVRRGGASPTLFVRDNGIGIEPQHLERVFGLFDKLDPGTEGTGIGLALVRRIVEAHGGRVWAESEGRGRGAAFCFTLPASQRRPDAPSAA